jgi:hypothetical protein
MKKQKSPSTIRGYHPSTADSNEDENTTTGAEYSLGLSLSSSSKTETTYRQQLY